MLAEVVILVILAYLLGSLNSAIITCKLMNLPSPYSIGSGNPGATNVLRLGGKKAAIITLAGDVLKGVIPLIVGHILHFDHWALSLLVLAAVIGHIFPVFFKFKGGKGVATMLGAVFALSPELGICFIISWLVVAAIFRFSSLASISACILIPLFSHFLLSDGTIIPLMITAIVIIIRHYGNIQRLIKGTESKIGKKKT
jgi:glycerol-3-phosphate acyltransferase PlsY